MKKTLITAASFVPLDRETIKARPELRVTGTADNATIDAMILAAWEAYEAYTENVLCESTWDLKYDAFPATEIETPALLNELAGSPLVTATSITYLDTSGNSQTLGASTYVVDGSDPAAGRIGLVPDNVWPTTYGRINAVTVRCVLGYASQAEIPQALEPLSTDVRDLTMAIPIAQELREYIEFIDVSPPFQARDKTGVAGATFAISYARITPQGGSIGENDMQHRSQTQEFEIWVRWFDGLTGFMEIVWGSRSLVMTGPPQKFVDVNNRAWWIIRAEEVIEQEL
jgi:uncharacterized phiE125 gp8 family phage protein